MAVQKTPPANQSISRTQTTPVRNRPASPARDTGAQGSTPAPASGYQPASGLGGKFNATPVVRSGRFAARASGLNRQTDVLGFRATVGDVVERFAEHLENPENPTARDLALFNQPFEAIG